MFSDPKRNIEQFGLIPGMKVADLGAGSGFYALASAQTVGNSGRVFAIDIQKDLLTKLKNIANHEKMHNIETIWGDLEMVGGTRLQDGSVDAVIISNILFQISNKDQFFQEVRRILKSNHHALLVDWADSYNGLGPPKADIITESSAKKLFEEKNFEFVRSISAGDHHYGMIFNKK